MRHPDFKKWLLIFLLVLLIVIGLRNYFLRFFITHYIEKELAGQCRIGRVFVNLNSIRIDMLQFSRDEIGVKVKKGSVQFNFIDFFKPPFLPYNKEISMGVDFDDIILRMERPKDLRMNFSFKGRIPGSNMVTISKLKIKDRELKDVVLPVTVTQDRIVFDKAPQGFLGPKALMQGYLDFKDFQNICLHLRLDDVSFSNVRSLISDKDDVMIDGLFEGEIDMCFDATGFSEVEADFYNTAGGLINVRREAPLAFLKRQLDEDSYNTLVANLKNYLYNKGELKVVGKGRDLILTVHFESYEMGERNITINFHDLL